MNAEVAVVYRPRPGRFIPASGLCLHPTFRTLAWFYQHTSAPKLGIRDYVNVFVKYEAGSMGGGGRGATALLLANQSMGACFYGRFSFFFKLHCSGPIEFTLPYRGTGG